MKKLIPIAVVLSLAILSGCSDDQAPTEPPPDPAPPRVVANKTVGAPTLSSVDEAVWSSVAEYAINVSKQNSPKLPGPASSIVTDSIFVKAIVSGGELFLRIELDDDSLNQLKDHNSITDSSNVNFVVNDLAHEDQLYVLFAGLPNNASDVWSWRALETAPAGLAEGYTLRNDTLFRDAGGQIVALSNAAFNGRPPWVHKDGSAFTGPVLYLEDRDATSNHLSDIWLRNQIVPGYYIDTLVRNRVHPDSALKQSRWDIFTVHSYDAVNDRLTIVLKRKLDTGWQPEDLVLADSVQVRIGVFDDQEDFFLGNNSQRGFTDLFWLIL